MKVVARQGENDLASVFVGRLDDGELVEFVESVQPPVPLEEKWVLIVSTLRGCPVCCPICDAGKSYAGRLTVEEILAQTDYLVRRRFPDLVVPVPKFKIQFARMGDPAFNPSVLDALRKLPGRYEAPGLLPSISSIAPAGCLGFLEELTKIKNEYFREGRFQMQFSIHTTCQTRRWELIPCSTLDFHELSEWGREFWRPGDRKISLNFAAVRGYPVDPEVISGIFPSECFMIKLTPVNPTGASIRNGLTGLIDPERPESADELVRGFRSAGFDTILSIGEMRENQIGSNCGMYLGAAEDLEAPCVGEEKYQASVP